MKNTLRALLALAVAIGFTATAAAQSRIEEFTLKSDILGTEKTCSVYLPDGYDASKGDYPVLYLLHGAGGCHTNWIEYGLIGNYADQLIAEGIARPMVIVMPDASGEGEKRKGPKMGYFDVPGWSYEKFFFAEFMPAVEKRFGIRSQKGSRAIAGLSMGGGGTAVYALRHPEKFSSACPLSALLDTIPGQRTYDPVFMQSAAANSPLKLLREMNEEQIAALRTVRWWVDCGDDDFLYESNIRFYEMMRKRNIPLQYRMRDGVHNWLYWQTALPAVLTYISAGFEK